MKIGKMVAAHHQLAGGSARVHHTKSMFQAAFVALDLVRKTTLQGFARVIEPLLRFPYKVEQLAAQRARATFDLPLEIYDIGDNLFGGSARGGRAQVCDKITNGKINFMTDSRDDWHRGIEYCAC